MKERGVERLSTGIPGLDQLAGGGLPRERACLVAGTTGSGKTILAAQFLAGGIAAGEPGVFVAFEEQPEELRTNLQTLGWDIPGWEEKGLWTFVDLTPDYGERPVSSGEYDLGGLIARVEHAVKKTGAKRLAIDSMNLLLRQVDDVGLARWEVQRLIRAVRRLGVTTVITAENQEGTPGLTRHGIEEFVAESVVVLRNELDSERRRRTIEVLKLRGAGHSRGQYPFTIQPDGGIVVIPLAVPQELFGKGGERVSTGCEGLDRMSNGGVFRGSVTLVSGATGTGKTLTAAGFVAAAGQRGERSVLISFEESPSQLFQNTKSSGIDLQSLYDQGLLKVESAYPEAAAIETRLASLQEHIRDFQPTCVALDGLSSLERAVSEQGLREFVLGLISQIKLAGLTAFVTVATRTIMGGESASESHVSTLADCVVLLRYVETKGSMRRGVTILKMRGSDHDRDIREFRISNDGLQVGEPFHGVSGILSGNPREVGAAEVRRLAELFQDEGS